MVVSNVYALLGWAHSFHRLTPGYAACVYERMMDAALPQDLPRGQMVVAAAAGIAGIKVSKAVTGPVLEVTS